MVSILDDLDGAETHSHSSRNSRRSLRDKKRLKKGAIQPSLVEESIDDILDKVSDDDLEMSETGEEPFINFEDKKTKPSKFEDGDGFDVYVDGAR